jgi:protoporphyrinogen oxidase
MNNKVAVIGAGPAGLSAAYCLSKAGFGVDIYEADTQVGGLAKSIELWGHKVDLGPHRFFSSDSRVNNLWLEIMKRDYCLVNRRTRILYNKRFFDYPLNAKNTLQTLGLFESARCMLSSVSTRSSPDDGSYESWLIHRFGKRLYDIFFRSYSEKLWGLPCSKIDADFAAQRIQKLNLREAIKSAFNLTPKNKHRTLCDQFAYPDQGTGTLYERMAEIMQRNGGNLFLKTPIKKVLIKDKTVEGVELCSGEICQYSQVISSMPLNLLVKTLTDTPNGVIEKISKLQFRNTVLVYLRVDSENLFPDQWIYIQSPELKLGRITNFKNWGEQLNKNKEDSVLCLEYWCSENESCWKWDDSAWSKLANNELQTTGLLGNAKVLDQTVIRIAKSYPVYHLGYKEDLRPVETYLRTISGLDVVGRYGAFKYNNQNHSILMGLLAAEHITHNANHDLWAVNSDSEDYQESLPISESGLA